ncbi:MAG: hypothetical protein BroJett024_05420 [Alphaproteobacteria bacterium]|nr:MAG: hypothetical protein BroJett024_05420 [Alphaproteobacteria bacterium]
MLEFSQADIAGDVGNALFPQAEPDLDRAGGEAGVIKLEHAILRGNGCRYGNKPPAPPDNTDDELHASEESIRPPMRPDVRVGDPLESAP